MDKGIKPLVDLRDLGGKMTKRELMEALSLKFENLNIKDAEMAVDTVFDSMTDALARGERIEIRGFGSFHVKTRNPRDGRNPRSGEKVKVSSKKVPFFKVGKELKRRINK